MIKPTYQEFTDNGQKIYLIKCKPQDISIKIIGNTLHGAKVNGINGTFFDTPNPKLTKSCWGLAVSEGKPIGENSFTVDYGGRKRGVVAWNGKEMICRRINKYTEIPNMIWGTSGVMLLPEYSRSAEEYLDDVYRQTNHTVIGFDKNNIAHLIVRENSTMTQLINLCAKLNLIGAVNLDGGLSSQIRFNDKGLKTMRILNSAVIVK